MTSDGIINLVKTYGDLIEAIHISPLLITTGSKAYNDLFLVQHINNKYKYKSYPYDPIEMSNDYFNCSVKFHVRMLKWLQVKQLVRSILFIRA
jgi:hypothetical protein